MLQQSTVQFLKQLKKNNSKEWFDANRKKYDEAKQDYISFVQKIIAELGKIDSDLGTLEPKQCMFRINRDVRFSNDKSPYKTNMGAYMAHGGRKSILSGYYFHLEPGNSFVGGGLWMPQADVLKSVRQEIDYSFNEFSKIIKDKKFISQYDKLDKEEGQYLSRPPKGYEIDNPAIEYIKLKSFTASKRISDEELTDKNLFKTTMTALQALTPLVTFINRAIEH